MINPRSKQAELRQIAITETLHPYLIKDVAELVHGYSETYFTPSAVYKIKDENTFIVITCPKQSEINTPDVKKRIAAYLVKPPNDIQQLTIKDIITESFAFENRGKYYFSGGEITELDCIANAADNKKVTPIIDGTQALLDAGVSKDVLDRLNINYAANAYQASQPKALQEKLIAAVKHNDEKEISRLIIHEKADPNTADEQGTPVLILAIKENYLPAVMTLVENGADIESRANKDGDYRTALLYATFNYYSQTVLKSAARNPSLIRYLISHNADVNARDVFGRSCLHFLSAVNDAEMFKFFLQHRAEPGSITMISDARAVELYSFLNFKSQAPLQSYHMNRDAEDRVSHWSYQEGTYTIFFRDDISSNDIRRAWEAIVNKIKSQKISDELGLIANKTNVQTDLTDANCLMTYPFEYVHIADILTPDCKLHAIEQIRGDKQKIVLTLANDFKHLPAVHKKITDIFSEMRIKPAPIADIKLSEHPATLFSAAGLDLKPSDGVNMNHFNPLVLQPF